MDHHLKINDGSGGDHPLLVAQQEQQQPPQGEIYYDYNTYMFRYRVPKETYERRVNQLYCNTNVPLSTSKEQGDMCANAKAITQQQQHLEGNQVYYDYESRSFKKKSVSAPSSPSAGCPPNYLSQAQPYGLQQQETVLERPPHHPRRLSRRHSKNGADSTRESSQRNLLQNATSAAIMPMAPYASTDDVENVLTSSTFTTSIHQWSSNQTMKTPPSFAFHGLSHHGDKYPYDASSFCNSTIPSDRRICNHQPSCITSSASVLGNTCAGRVKTMIVVMFLSAMGAFFTITVCIQYAVSSSSSVGNTRSGNPSTPSQMIQMNDNVIQWHHDDTLSAKLISSPHILSEERNSFMKGQMLSQALASDQGGEEEEKEQRPDWIKQSTITSSSSNIVNNEYTKESLKEKHGTCYFPNLEKSHEMARQAPHIQPLGFPIINVGLPYMGSHSIYNFFQCAAATSSDEDSHNIKQISHHMCQQAYEDGMISHQLPCGSCMEYNSRRGNPILQNCGNYHAFTKIDNIDGSSDDGSCFFPQIELLEQIHQEAPFATFVLPFGDLDHWIKRLKEHPFIQDQLINCHFQDLLPRGVGLYDSQLRQFMCDHVTRIRDFVIRHPTHSLIEFNIDADTTGQLLSALFFKNTRQQDELASCWTFKVEA